MGTTSNSEATIATGVALNITTNKKDEIYAVNCLDPTDLALR